MTTNKSNRGRLAYEKGQAAETQVAKHYDNTGATQLARRWRGKSGEIDLIFQDGDVIVFVEVKSSKNASWAANALSQNQQKRIMAAAEEYCANLETGSLTDMRFDVALICDHGSVEILEAALGV